MEIQQLQIFINQMKTMFKIWLMIVKQLNFLAFVFSFRHFEICGCFLLRFLFCIKLCENLRYRLAVLMVNSKRRALWHILACLSPFDFSFYQKSSSVLEIMHHKNNQSSNNTDFNWAQIRKNSFKLFSHVLH